MPMTREERHALAARIRLGETCNNVPGPYKVNDWLYIGEMGQRYALGIPIYIVFDTEVRWEDGTIYNQFGKGIAAVLDYLERP